MQERSSKSSQQGESEKGFSLVRTDTIQLWSLLEDCPPLDEHSLKSLSEDVSYRVREITDSAVNYMHHCRRSQLKTSDMNRAFQMANIEKTFGYISKEPFEYNTVRVDELDDKLLSQFKTSLYELKDETVELRLPPDETSSLQLKSDAAESPQPPRRVATTNRLQASWHTFSNNSHSIKSENTSNLINTDETEAADLVSSQLHEPFSKYYTMCTSAILGIEDDDYDENDDDVFNQVLNDLRTNNKIQPVLPFIVSFFSQAIQKLTSVERNKSPLDQTTNVENVCRVLSAIRCVVSNRSLFLASKPIFSKIVSCLLFCAIQNTAFVVDVSSSSSSGNSLVVREQAASILVLFLRLYERFALRTITYLTEVYFKPNLSQLEQQQQKQPESSSESFHLSHTVYGVLCFLIRFGGQMIEDFLPILARLVVNIEAKPKPTVMDTVILKTCLKCSLVHFKWTIRKCLKKKKKKKREVAAAAVYESNTTLFGDAFSNQAMGFIVYQSSSSSSSSSDLTSVKLSKIDLEEIERVVRSKSFKYLDFVREEKKQSSTLTDYFDEFKPVLKRRLTINYGRTIEIMRLLSNHNTQTTSCCFRSCQSQSIVVGRLKYNSNKIKCEYAAHLNDAFL